MVTSKKKILFVDHDPYITGSTVSMRYLIHGFYEKDIDITLLSSKSKESLDFFKNYNIDFVHWKYRVNLPLDFTISAPINSIRGIKDLLRLLINFIKGCILSFILLKNTKPDLIYINEYVLSQFSISGKLLGIPVVTHVRSPFLKGNWGIRKYLLSNHLKTFNKFVFAISNQEANQILENINNEKNNIIVVREFLNDKDFYLEDNNEELKKLFSIPANKKIILMAGGIEQIKGSLEMIEAFGKMILNKMDLFLVIAGPISTNSYSKKCFDYISNNGLENKICIINFTKDIHKLIACCDVLVSSLTSTHFSRPIIEAWAQKKAVVASDTPHSKEFIEDSIDGLLYQRGNPDSLAEKMINLFRNDEKIIQLGEAGYLKSRKEFSAEINVQKIIDYCIPLL